MLDQTMGSWICHCPVCIAERLADEAEAARALH
jgi:hypothetical protein